MDYTERIQDAVDYIETRLMEDLSLNEVASRAAFSLTHFCRIFQAMTGETLGEYVRRRRLSQAASLLPVSKRRIVDIAFDLQFDSQEAFTRAFAREFGITPGRYRRSPGEVVLFEPVNIRQRLQGRPESVSKGINIDARVVMRGEIKLVGREMKTTVAVNKEQGTVQRFWDQHIWPRVHEIQYINDKNRTFCLESYDPRDDSLYHLGCFLVDEIADVPEGMVAKVLQPQRYAVFSPERAVNPVEYDQLSEFAYAYWLPRNGLEPIHDFFFDTYERVMVDGSERWIMEVYIPVR